MRLRIGLIPEADFLKKETVAKNATAGGDGEVKGIDETDLYFAVAFILWAFDKIQFAIIAYAIGLLCIFLRGFERAAKRRIKNNRMENEVEK